MKFIFKIFNFIFTLLIAIIIFTYIFSLKNNISFESAITYFKTIGSEILGINKPKDSIINSDIDDNSIIITSRDTHYYYNQLNDTAKIIYNSLEDNIENLKKENYVIDFSTKFNDLLNQTTGKYNLNKAFQSALDAFFYDHPELFYIDLTKISLNIKSFSLGSLTTYTVEIIPNDNNYLHSSFNSENEVELAIKQVENVKNTIINTISDYSTYNKIKYVHDMLVNSIEYNGDYSSNSYNIYGAFVEKKVVCEGYAKAFKYIMDNLNIECILVTGKASNTTGQTEAHMWNYLKLNDAWYGVDVTWDDPIIIGGSNKNNLRYDYFIKGYYTFYETHVPSGKISNTGMLFKLPSLSDNNYR